MVDVAAPLNTLSSLRFAPDCHVLLRSRVRYISPALVCISTAPRRSVSLSYANGISMMKEIVRDVPENARELIDGSTRFAPPIFSALAVEVCEFCTA